MQRSFPGCSSVEPRLFSPWFVASVFESEAVPIRPSQFGLRPCFLFLQKPFLLKKQLLLIFSSVISGISSVCQESDSARHTTPVPQWIEPMNKYITLKFTQSTDVDEINVHGQGTAPIELTPNLKSISRLALNYKFITIGAAFTLKFLPWNNNDSIRGKSKAHGFTFGTNFSNWMLDFAWHKTKGFYLANTKHYRPSWEDGDAYIQFPDLVLNDFQGITAYKFNENYSINAAATQSERQLKSAGTFIIPFIYRYFTVTDNTPRKTPADPRQRSSNFEFTLAAGYYYTFVLKRSFYITLGATPGGGIMFSRITTETETTKQVTRQTNPIFRLDARFGIGYNSERFFIGVYNHGFVTTYKQNRSVAVTDLSRLAYQVFLGYRINAPKFLKKEIDRAEKLMKIL